MVPTKEGILVGGSINALLGLIKETSVSHRLCLYTHTDKGLKENFESVNLKGVNIYVDENWFSSGSMLYGLYFLLLSLWRFIREKAWDVDVIHGHSGFVYYAIVTALAGKIFNCPTVHSLYCPIEIQNTKTIRAFLKTKFFYYSLVSVDRLVAMSENIRKSLIKLGIPDSKIKVLPPFFDTVRFNPELYSNDLRKELGADTTDIPIILFVGNLKASKGIDLLVDALGLIVNECNFRFVYTLELKDKTFDKKLSEIKERIERKNLSSRTLQLGIINSMPALMASSDFIVVPYRDTNGPSDYPIALMEAMASGIPAVATTVGGIPELVEDGVTGLLCNPEDIADLAQKIKKLIDDPIYRKNLGNNARSRCLEIMKNRNIMNEVRSIYREISEKYTGRKDIYI